MYIGDATQLTWWLPWPQKCSQRSCAPSSWWILRLVARAICSKPPSSPATTRRAFCRRELGAHQSWMTMRSEPSSHQAQAQVLFSWAHHNYVAKKISIAFFEDMFSPKGGANRLFKANIICQFHQFTLPLLLQPVWGTRHDFWIRSREDYAIVMMGYKLW